MNTNIEPRRASWRMLITGSTVWAPFGESGWRPGIITGLGKNRGDRTIVHSEFRNGRQRPKVRSRALVAQARAQGQRQAARPEFDG
jgi:hypothetical protein